MTIPTILGLACVLDERQGSISANIPAPACSITASLNFIGTVAANTTYPACAITAAKFAPQDLSGCLLALWSDVGVALSGSSVTTWADQSGNSNNAAQGSTTPTQSASGGPNSAPSIDFASVQYMTLPTTLHPAAPATLVAVAKTTATSYAGLLIPATVTNKGVAMFARLGTAHWGLYQNADASSGADDASFKKLIAVVRNYNDADLRTNGSSVTVATGVSAYGPQTNGLIGTGLIGSQDLLGSIAALFVFSRALSVGECQQIESCLATRYGL